MRISASLCCTVLALAALTAVSAQTTKPSAAPKAKPAVHTKAPILAATPPMGWNSWNYFARNVDDKGVRAAADQIVATGMKDAG